MGHYDDMSAVYFGKEPEANAVTPKNKYSRTITNASGQKLENIDVYDVLVSFNVTNPAIAHAIKKLLCSGVRGYKDTDQDLFEAIQSIERGRQL